MIIALEELCFCRKAFKRIHSIGNLRLSRIQTRLEKDPTNGDIFLKTPFAWPQSLSNENEVTDVEPRADEFSQVEEREMYIGSRRSSAKHREMEDLYRGSVQDIKEGCIIAVLDTNDACDYPFWIAKFMKVNK